MIYFMRQLSGYHDLRSVHHPLFVGDPSVDHIQWAEPGMSTAQLVAIVEHVLGTALTEKLLCSPHGGYDPSLLHLAGLCVAFYLKVWSPTKDLQTTLILNLATRIFNERYHQQGTGRMEGVEFIASLLAEAQLPQHYISELTQRWVQEDMQRLPWWLELNYM